MGRLGLRAPLLVLLGAIALVVSFLLTPTSDTFDVLSNGHRVRVAAEMHAVDYAILVLRIGGVVVLIAGAYLAYRQLAARSGAGRGRSARPRVRQARGHAARGRRSRDTERGHPSLLRRNTGV